MVTAQRHRSKVWLLVNNVNAPSGVVRTTLNLAAGLARSRPVEVLSLFSGPGRGYFAAPPGVRVRFLTPLSHKAGRKSHHLIPEDLRELATRPSTVMAGSSSSAYIDHVLTQVLGSMAPGDVIVGTRINFNLALVELNTRDDIHVVGWDHLNFESHYEHGPSAVTAALERSLPRLDAYVVLTDADRADYQRLFPGSRIRRIRNSMSWSPSSVDGAHDRPVVVAAGRLREVKGFDLLIRAWEIVQKEFPEWSCLILGKGTDREALATQIAAAGVSVKLAGHVDDVRDVFASSAIFAMSSRREGLPMVLIEAQTEGLPVVSFDCPRGPGEIVRDGANGRLVSPGDVAGFAEAIKDLIRDPVLRRRMGAQGRIDAGEYAVDRVVADWERLLAELGQPELVKD